MKLTREELELLFKMTIQYLKSEGINEISFNNNDNYYPKIWHHDVDFSNPEFMKCPRFTIGSLPDDIDDLKKVLNGRFELVPLHLEKLGAILTQLGATI